MNLRKAESQMSIVSDSRASLLDGGGSESAMSLWNAGSSSNLLNTTNNTTTKPRHLAITGNEAVDKQNLDDWTAVQQRLEKRLGDELADKIEALQSHTAVTVLRHCDTIHLRFSRALGREVQDRVEDLCEKWREATRLVGDEKIGIERARKYLHWHVMLARIEHEAGVIEDAVDGLGRATRVGGGETDLDELQTRLVASERALSMFLQMTEQDKPQDASSTSTRPAVSQDERKVTRTLRRHQSLATLQVMGVAEQFSAAVLKNRSDALSAKMARITARILEARDEVGHRRRLMTVLEEVSRLGGWCERKEMEMLERQAGLPPRVLLDDRPYQKSATAQNTTASLPDTILETVQNALKDSITQNSHIEYELTHSRSALERLAEHLDKNQVTDLQAKFTKIESLVAAEKKRIEATKRLYALDRAMVQVTNWIGAAVAAAEDIAATQRAHQPPRQSLVVEEQFGGGSEDLLNEGAATGTVEEVMELEDRIRAYETTVTGFFNVAAAATDELAGTSPSTSDTASPISPAVAATQAAYRSSITWRTDRVRVEWETLLTLVGSLRGSSEDRRREVEFNDEVDEINRGLIYIQSLITDGANDATWDEAEDLLDARMLPRVAALRRRADSAARDARERKRFVAKHQSLEKRVRALLEQVQKRHSRAEPSLMDRRVARLVEELETCIGEFSPIVQKAAAGAAAASAMAEGVPLPAPSPTTTPTSSTAADLGLLGSTLEKQTEMYEMRISDLLTRLREACIAAHDETSVQEWIGKWETARAWKVQVANELARLRRAGSEHGRGNNKPAQVTTSRTPQMAVTVTESARQRPISDPPQRAATQSRIQSPQPPRAATATPDASGRGSRSSSPRRSNLPLPTRSRSITPPTHAATTTVKIPRIPSTPSTTTRPSTARSSSTSDPTSPHGNPTSDRTVRVYIPSPNAYKADASDPLDVALAQVVNAHPAMIRIEKSNTEQGRYWFGEALRRLCFCRLVRRTVMVRIGGGWQELGTFLADHSALELRIPTVRSFSHPDNILDPTSPSTASTNATETTMIELDPGDTTNPYALSSSKARAYAASPVQSPRKLVAKALAKVATRKAQY
ncbi:hypothetical protein DFJ77DRAFT_455310 [Powellomyces hirtus]|nr:hypothetical protein DFJ77DRAFT_455310 [Powellomyces hirtus]